MFVLYLLADDVILLTKLVPDLIVDNMVNKDEKAQTYCIICSLINDLCSERSSAKDDLKPL